MQTIPSFVYLVPIVMLFGVGIVPGVIATIIFALPPIIRLTNLGIRQVQSRTGRGRLRLRRRPRGRCLWEIQLPLAMRTIMAGLNQTLMLALSMVVIAALIGAGGLGLTVYTGLGRLDVGTASVGGLGIVLMAIVLDRITQAYGTGPAAVAGGSSWTFTGFGKAALAFPGHAMEALRGDRKQIAHVVRVGAVTAIAVALVVWSAASVEPGEGAMRTAWSSWTKTASPKQLEAVEGEHHFRLARKRACTRTPFFEQGFLCSFLVIDRSDKDVRHVRRARFGTPTAAGRSSRCYDDRPNFRRRNALAPPLRRGLAAAESSRVRRPSRGPRVPIPRDLNATKARRRRYGTKIHVRPEGRGNGAGIRRPDHDHGAGDRRQHDARQGRHGASGPGDLEHRLVPGRDLHPALEDLGYTVKKTKELKNELFYQAVSQGDVDFWVNGWFPLHNTYERPSARARRMIGYVAKGGALQGYLVDKKTADKYHIKYLSDFKKPEDRQAVRHERRRQGRHGRLPAGLGLREGDRLPDEGLRPARIAST